MGSEWELSKRFTMPFATSRAAWCLVLETNDGWSKEVKKTAKMGWVVCFVPHGEARGGRPITLTHWAR